MKNENKILLFLGIFISSVSFAQEALTFVAIKDTTAFSWENDEIIVINTGDKITTNSKVGYYETSKNMVNLHLGIKFKKSDIQYTTPAKDFLPADTKDTFGNDIFIDYPVDYLNSGKSNGLGNPIFIGDVDEMWVPAYYCDVLKGKDRNKLLEIHKGFPAEEYMGGHKYSWYESEDTDIQNGRAMFYNTVIKLGLGTHFAVKNIKKTDYGYAVDCVESISDGRYEIEIFIENKFWDKYKPGDEMTLYLYIDGDYLDIYVDSKDIHFGTFVRVKRDFIKQYQSLIKTNTCDLTNVQWPRRADGSMDYNTPNLQAIEETNIDEPYEGINAKNNAERHFIPLWAWFAIIGGTVVVGGCAAFFIIKRKK